MEAPAWLEEAECLGTRSEIFFPPELDDDDGTAGYSHEEYEEAYGPAKAICAVCPVRVKCLDHALEKKERWGVWGGLIPIERLRIERKWRRQRLRQRRAAECEARGDSDIEPTLEEEQ